LFKFICTDLIGRQTFNSNSSYGFKTTQIHPVR